MGSAGRVKWVGAWRWEVRDHVQVVDIWEWI